MWHNKINEYKDNYLKLNGKSRDGGTKKYIN